MDAYRPYGSSPTMISRPAKPWARAAERPARDAPRTASVSIFHHSTASYATTIAICNSVTYAMLRVKVLGKSSKTLDIRNYQPESVA